MIYEPREDSFLLQKVVRREVKTGDKVIDIGTGSGIQAVTALEKTGDVTAADVNPECIKKLKENQPWIKAIESDLFENISEKFDIIIFNPPYLPRDKREPKDSVLATTGGLQGNEIITEFLKQAKKHLEKDGKILLAYSSLSGDIPSISRFLGYTLEIISKQSFDFETIYAAVLKSRIISGSF
ncbi:MAG: methyltransferase [Nanoarchaeota archaeon]|nr:methyltransferase [Nanoarchaeota archaeon]